MSDVTDLLRLMRSDDRGALDGLFAIVYDDLHRMAQSRLARDTPITLLDPTSLVHETYLRLRQAAHLDLPGRAQFLAYASHVLRSIIVDFARQRLAQRRGGNAVHLALTTGMLDGQVATDSDIERVDDALNALGDTDPRLRSIVEMRYFAGMTEQEVADSLGVAERTVRRDWQRARMLLSVSLQA